MSLFSEFAPVGFAPGGAGDDLAFRVYQPERVVLGRRMVDWLRWSVCFWHSFSWSGADVFGGGTLPRPWLAAVVDETMAMRRLEAAFDFLRVLGAPYFCFHDLDVMASADNLPDHRRNLQHIEAAIAERMSATGVGLLWGTANLFSHPRYAAGAATSPDPEVFAYAAAQVRLCLETTQRLGGHNYVLWGGREGYDTLLNTDLVQEREQYGRFLAMVVEHKHRIGFKGAILIEPKPFEPTKHQYDRDVAAVDGFLRRFGLHAEVQVNIEVNHATLAGLDFEHEIAAAIACGLLGSIDMNRGDPRNGWDTDQFPNNAQELTPAMLLIMQAGGLGSGGFNFDAKLRRQSVDARELLVAHIAGVDTLARALLAAAQLIESGELARLRAARYAGWRRGLGGEIAAGQHTLASLGDLAQVRDLRPAPKSGRQEWLESLVAAANWPG